MASAAEQLAANLSFSTFSKATELKKRIWFTLGALLIFRLGTYIPIPGINAEQYAAAFDRNGGGFLDTFDAFAGGAVGRMAIFALGIMPYISASIIMQLMTSVIPTLEQLKKEGEQGRKVINQYTRYGTVLLATVQAYALAAGLNASDGIVDDPGGFFIMSAVITLVGGTMFLMWLGEQITARGIGNGVSLLIMAGIIAALPGAFANLFEQGQTGAISTATLLGILLLVIVTLGIIVFFERALRKILVQYPKRQIGNRMFQGDTSSLPLKLNTAGVIPAIFASSLLLLPATIAGFQGGGVGEESSLPEWAGTILALLGPGQPGFIILYAALIAFFAFFYTAIVVNPKDMADNLKKQGGFIPGIRPGQRTADYIDYVLTRITVVGAAYLVVVCTIPELFRDTAGISFVLGGTSLLIIVSVTLDTVQQIQGHLLAHQYGDLIQKSKLRGGKRRR